MNVFHVECLQGIQKKMCTDNQNVNLGPRRKVWIGEADLRAHVALELRKRIWNKKRSRLRTNLRKIEFNMKG